MLRNNIFDLINKTATREDQLSLGFGFLLKQYPRLLGVFLQRIDVSVPKKELKKFDIESQVEYWKHNSRIDLQLNTLDQWFILCESKVVSTKPEVLVKQLKKYVNILNENKAFYEKGQRLVVIAPQMIADDDIKRLKRELNVSEEILKFLSWDDLVSLIELLPRTELLTLFHKYLGDSMNNIRAINERKIKEIEEVLVVFTNPAFWEMTLQKNIAVQRRGACDAQYIAFLRTHLPEKDKSQITHIAKVSTTQFVPRKTMIEGLPKNLTDKLVQHGEKRGADWDKEHKQYNLKPGSLIPLANPIIHNVSGIQVSFRTTFAELLKAKTTKEIKKGRRS